VSFIECLEQLKGTKGWGTMTNLLEGVCAKNCAMRGGRMTKFKGVVASFAPVIGIALSVSFAGSAFAQSVSWDATSGNSAIDGGSGNWDAATQNWTTDAGATNEVWTDGADAVFGGNAGSVTLVGTQSAASLTFDTDGYDISGGTLSYSNGGSGITVHSGTATIASDISASAGLVKSGSGTLVLSGANTFTGSLDVQNGSLVVGNAAALGSMNIVVVQNVNNPVHLDLGGYTFSADQLILNGTSSTSLSNGTINVSVLAQLGNGTFSAVLGGTSEVSRPGTGGTATLTAVNTYTGPTLVLGSTLAIASTGSILNTSAITISGGTLSVDGKDGNAISDTQTINNSGTFRLVGSDETIGAIYGSGNISLGSQTLTTGNAVDAEISGVVSGTGDLNYQGSAILTLSGANTLTGDIENTGGGTVVLSGSTAGNVVNTSGTFNNAGAISGNVTNTSGTFNANTGGTYGGNIDNEAQFNIATTSFDLNGVFTNNGAVTNTSGDRVALVVGTGANFINNGTIDGGSGASHIAIVGDEFTLAAGNRLTGNYSIDVETVTSYVQFDLSGTTDFHFNNHATADILGAMDFSGRNLTNTSIVNVSGGDFVGIGVIDNSGTIAIGGGAGLARSLEANTITNSGTINVNDGSTLKGIGNTSNNSGTINVAGGGTLIETTGDFNNLSGGAVNFNDAGAKTFDAQAGVITNAGDLNFNAGTTTVNSLGGAIQNNAGGTIAIAAAATMDASGDTIQNAGSITMASATSALSVGTLTNNTSGVVNAQGTLTGAVINQGSGDFNAVAGLSGITSFTNSGTASLEVQSGTSAIGSLNNTSGGTGTGLATAGVRVAAAGVVSTGTATNSGTGTINNAGTFGATTITNGDGTNAATLTNTGTLTASSGISNAAGANLISNGATINGNVANSGAASLSGALAGTLSNNGAGTVVTLGNLTSITTLTQNSSGLVTVAGGHRLEAGTIANTAGSAGIAIAANATLAGTGNTLNNAATISVASGGTLTDVGAINNLSTGIIDFALNGVLSADTDIAGDEGITNAGIININGGTTAISLGGAGIFANSNLLNMAAGTSLNVTGDLTNTGTLNAQNGATNNTIALNGNYIGGGNLNIDVDFGADTSDVLAINGDITSATTTVSVADVSTGPVTGNDIIVASITGTGAADAFILATPLTFGARSYGFSQSGSNYVLGATGYVDDAIGIGALAHSLLLQNDLPTLKQRAGGQSSFSFSQGKPAGWFVIDGGPSRFAPASSSTGYKGKMDSMKLRGGLNFDVLNADAGQLVVGVHGSYGIAHSFLKTSTGSSTINTSGFSLGLSATWLATSGFYVDGQVQYATYENTLAASGPASSTNANGLKGALEIGRKFDAVGSGWTLTPRANLRYSSVKFDDFTSGGGLTASMQRATSKRLGLGITAERNMRWAGSAGRMQGMKFYALADIYKEFDGAMTTTIAGSPVTSQLNGLSADIGLGLSRSFNDGLGLLYMEVSMSGSLQDLANDRSLSVGLGGKWSF
jgi:fibronectin-binding autotransporter adhesin